MKAIILAGGKGTRLQKIVSDLPKPLAPIQGQPFIYILIRFLLFHKVEQIVISTQHLADKFAEHLPGLRKMCGQISLVKEPAPLGTGGALRFACQNISADEHVLVLNGDTFFDFDLAGFVKKYNKDTALALKEVPDSSRYGTVEFSNGQVRLFWEKSPTVQLGAIYAGFSILKVKDLFDLLPDGYSSLEKDFFPKFLQEKRNLKGEIFDGKFIDIGVPEDYENANSQFDFSKFSK
jgi:D-glycero-alpha-D-manno-heptose 1-phosphate guanylyltransferase